MYMEITNREVAMREKFAKIKQQAVRLIWVTFQKEGIHAYPAAASDPKLADVSFLGYPHRHIFHFNVAIQVNHNDRDIEFIQFKRWCEELYAGDILQLNSKSCEMIADELYDQIAMKYPDRAVVIDVSEDKENGCNITYQAAVDYKNPINN